MKRHHNWNECLSKDLVSFKRGPIRNIVSKWVVETRKWVQYLPKTTVSVPVLPYHPEKFENSKTERSSTWIVKQEENRVHSFSEMYLYYTSTETWLVYGRNGGHFIYQISTEKRIALHGIRLLFNIPKVGHRWQTLRKGWTGRRCWASGARYIGQEKYQSTCSPQ